MQNANLMAGLLGMGGVDPLAAQAAAVVQQQAAAVQVQNAIAMQSAFAMQQQQQLQHQQQPQTQQLQQQQQLQQLQQQQMQWAGQTGMLGEVGVVGGGGNVPGQQGLKRDFDEVQALAEYGAPQRKFARGDWNCPTCQDLQFARNEVCRRCGTPKPYGAGMMPGDWHCPNCNDLQFARNEVCRRCATPKPPDAGYVPGTGSTAPEPVPGYQVVAGPHQQQAHPQHRGHVVSAGDWTCPKCADLQFSRNEVCRRCGTARPAAGAGFPTLPGDWHCPRCNDLQFARNQACRRCGMPRPPAAAGEMMLAPAAAGGQQVMMQQPEAWGVAAAAGGACGGYAASALGPPPPPPPAGTPGALEASGGQPSGEVRFEHPDSARQALQLDGSVCAGHVVSVKLHERSSDGTKVIVSGLPEGVDWLLIKEHFSQAGPVAFAGMRKGKGKGKHQAPVIGQVRYDSAAEAEKAMTMLNNSTIGDKTITVQVAPGSKDNTKLRITNLPLGLEWQELKDHFVQAGGNIVFVECIENHPGLQLWGEIRFERLEDAQTALRTLNGSQLGGAQIFVRTEPNASERDQCRVIVSGVAPGTSWQELKDHFLPIGPIAFAQVHQEGGKGWDKGWGKGYGKGGGGGHDPSMAMGGGYGGGWHGGYAPKGYGGPKGGGGAGGAPWAGGKGGGAFKGGKGKGFEQQYHPAVGSTLRGEVRFESPLAAQMALALNMSTLQGMQIVVEPDWKSPDGTRLFVSNLPPSCSWQDLKDHFTCAGSVAYAGVRACA